MSDDRTTDPTAGPSAAGEPSRNDAADTPVSPYAPQTDAETPPYAAPPAADAPAADAPATDAPAAGAAYGAAPQTYGAPAYGAPAYGAPAYGAAPYGQPGYGYGAAPARTNVLAILSLVASLAGFILFLPIVGQLAGAIMGHIALRRIKETGERGRGLALAGVLIGWISLGLIVVFIILVAVLIGTTAGSSGSRI